MPKSKLPPHVVQYTDTRGKTRYRAQKGGKKVELGTGLWDERFRGRYAAFLDAAPRPVAPKYAAGTFAALITAYQASDDFAKYASGTKTIYRQVFQRIMDLLAEQPCGDRWFTTRHAQALIDKVKSPAARDTFRKKLGVLMRFAMRTGVRDTDPVAATKSGYQASDGIAPWTQDQVQAALAAHPINTPTGLALRIMSETGAALADVVRLGPANMRGGCIIYKRQKSGKKSAPDAVCPLSPELLAHLSTITTPTFLTHDGKARSSAGLGNRVRAVAKGQGFARSAHGIRKARGNELFEAGAELGGIAAILGHSGTTLTAHYTKAAARISIAKTAAQKSNLNSQIGLTESKNDE